MSKNPSSRRNSLKKEIVPKAHKENVDSVYIIQNQNEVLKIKNIEMQQTIAAMKSDLIGKTQSLQLLQDECSGIRNLIQSIQFVDDMKLQTQKTLIEEKIQFMKGNCQIVATKIGEAREAVMIEEGRIPIYKEKQTALNSTLWQCKTQNQGSKIVLSNLERQLERYRKQNAELVTKRKQNGPKQAELSSLIEDRLRLIKNRHQQSNTFAKQQSSYLIYILLSKLLISKTKESFMILQKVGLFKKQFNKQFYLMSLIRKKYLLFIKNQILQKFRQNFRPLKQIQAAERIISNTQKRRIKNRLFRVWRNESNKRQYIKIRYFQAQTTIQKLVESYRQSLLYSSFNDLKYHKKHALHMRSALIISSVYQIGIKRAYNSFISSLISENNSYLKDLQIQQSAKEQSMLLFLSIYFSGWAAITKERKVSNTYIKFKCFKELKNLLVLKNKRQLSQKLVDCNSEIMNMQIKSQNFRSIKRQTISQKERKVTDQKTICQNKNQVLRSTIKSFTDENKAITNKFCIYLISRFLKKQKQKAFNTLRTQTYKAHRLLLVMRMIADKERNDLNFGFACIQQRRFEKLKLSIADKIESCEFSYNYLVKENEHIKQVLDSKELQIQKNVFAKILQRSARRERQTKHKYFYKFLENGYKSWRFVRAYKRVDSIIKQRVGRVLMFLLKEGSKQKRELARISNKMEQKQNKINLALLSKSFAILQNICHKNRNIKRILSFIFQLSAESGVYNGFNAIKKLYTKLKQKQTEQFNEELKTKIKNSVKESKEAQNEIQILRVKLSKKQRNMKSLVVVACRKIFVRNSTNKLMSYMNRWRNKIVQQNKVKKLAEVLERKTKISLMNRLVLQIFKKKNQSELNELKQRFDNYTKQINESSSNYQKFIEESNEKIETFEKESEDLEKQGRVLEIKTDHMDNVKVLSFRGYWSKRISKNVLHQWRNQKIQMIERWDKVFSILVFFSQKQTFLAISQEMKIQILQKRVKRNLSRIHEKKCRYNAGLGLKIWRLVTLNKRIQTEKQAYQVEVSNHKQMTSKYEHITSTYDMSVNKRINDRKMRKIFDFLKRHTRMKIDNNERKKLLQKWIKRGYQAQFLKVFMESSLKSIRNIKKADQHSINKCKVTIQKLFHKLKIIVSKKNLIKKLFMNKFVHHIQLSLFQSFFSKLKNYDKYALTKIKNYKTYCIQKVLENFDKKRKHILCTNMRKWRKHQYEIKLGRDLFKKLTRKAIYGRLEGMFYIWRKETKAKVVLQYHHEEGEVKKRKFEIMRIEKFLSDFKKEKGLLLENEEGTLVLSPRFQKKKQEEHKKDKSLRYKFISRLILSANGYEAPIQAYNNLKTFARLREKYKQTSAFVINHLRRPDLFLAFRTWRKATQQFKDGFESMDRKQLIKILNRQKDRMQMEYSQKLDVDEKIEKQVRRHQVFSHRQQKKQKLCGLILIKYAKKIKSQALKQWQSRVQQMQRKQSQVLEQRGAQKLEDLEQQLRQMQMMENQLLLTNNRLRQTVNEAIEIAELVKRITEERDKLSQVILQKNVTCQSLLEENQVLNSKLHLAQREALRLLVISGEQP